MGVVLAIGKEGIRAFAPNGLVAASTATGSYPAFGTDNHPVLAALMTRASGYSRITETIWEDRFAYVTGLSKLMTRIWYAGRTVHVRPEKWTSGTCYIRCTDLRGGAAVTIAALGRMDDTILDNFEVVLRGYSRFVERLNGLGADLRIV
jgi:UDP-N-acetylglucosamine 1-carboxyvinyltransferase